jgi:hypothetical protein
VSNERPQSGTGKRTAAGRAAVRSATVKKAADKVPPVLILPKSLSVPGVVAAAAATFVFSAVAWIAAGRPGGQGRAGNAAAPSRPSGPRPQKREDSHG